MTYTLSFVITVDVSGTEDLMNDPKITWQTTTLSQSHAEGGSLVLLLLHSNLPVQIALICKSTRLVSSRICLHLQRIADGY